jgi:hypothetical protein
MVTTIMKPFKLIQILMLLAIATSYGQQTTIQNDSTTTSADSTQVTKAPVVYEEFILETIRIEAVIEKPSVTLIPKKAKTDVGDVPLNIRSFDKEIKTKPKSLSTYGEELETGKKIKKLDKK